MNTLEMSRHCRLLGGFCGIFFMLMCLLTSTLCRIYIVIISDDCQCWGCLLIITWINTKLSCCKNKMDAINSSNKVNERKESFFFFLVRFDYFNASIRLIIRFTITSCRIGMTQWAHSFIVANKGSVSTVIKWGQIKVNT